MNPNLPSLLRCPLLLWLLIGIAPAACGQGLEYVKANYTKHEYRIPMRDGTRLFTAVYVPKDDSRNYPMLMSRTPYGVLPYGVDQYRAQLGPSPLFAKEGYIFVYQDVRGRWMSEGEFVNMRPHQTEKTTPTEFDESSDTWDTVEWLVKNVANNNGKLGIWGTSYPGFYTAAGIIDAHPAVRAASPQAPITDWFAGDDWHHNGAFFLAHMFRFMASQGQPRPEPTKHFGKPFEFPTPDGYQFFLRAGTLAEISSKYLKNQVAFWNETMRHGAYDEFWQSRNLRPHLRGIRPAVMTVGGWFDAENLFGALETYRSIESGGPRAANTLVMGPWRHGSWSREPGDAFGDIPFNSPTGEFYREKIEFPFFQFHLKDVGQESLPEAWVFETGTNQWRRYSAWPPRSAKSESWFLGASGQLARKQVAGTGTSDSADEFVSDPRRPVPYINEFSTGMAATYMIADQRFASRRPDVLVYQSDILDADTTIAGPIEVDMFVSTTGTDSDWVIKLIDVYPDDYPNRKVESRNVKMGGYEQLVRGDVLRGKFRDQLADPQPFIPGEPTRIRFTLPDVYHAFRTGHRMMVQVQCSWFPLVDRNPQTFVDIYSARAEDFHAATQKVYRSTEFPSKITMPVLGK